jgi:hypothetical protein
MVKRRELRVSLFHQLPANWSCCTARVIEGLLRDPALQLAFELYQKQKLIQAWTERYYAEFEIAIDFLTRVASSVTQRFEEQRRRQREERSATTTKSYDFLSGLEQRNKKSLVVRIVQVRKRLWGFTGCGS